MYRSRGNCAYGSPFTIANGISTCSGAPSAGGAAGAALDTTIVRVGFISVRTQVHEAAHLIEGVPRHRARLVGTLGDDVAHRLRVVLELLRAPAHAADFLHDALDHRLFALEAADAGAAAAGARPLARRLVGIDLVQIPDRAFVGIAGIGAAHARRVGLHGPELLHHGVGIFAQADGVAVGLRHLAAVESRHLRRRREHRLGLGQDGDALAVQEAEQALAVGDRDAVVALYQRLGALERLGVASLLELAPQLPVVAGVARAETLHGELRPRLEVRLAPVKVVEAPRGLPRELDVRHLILAHRNVGAAVHQDVGALQQRVTEESVGREILLLELLLLILVARHPLEPAERHDHRQQQVELGVLGHVRLDEEGCDPGVETGRQPVDQHLAHVLLQLPGVIVPGGEHVPVGDEEETLVLVLQLHPVAQRAVVVAEVQPAGGPHAGDDAPGRRGRAHVPPRSDAAGDDAGNARRGTRGPWLTVRIIAHAKVWGRARPCPGARSPAATLTGR